ncbi:Xaa-Pro aminopeptidase [Candidatus Williamhamiltonella defendens]|nr:Xaa-Pro aminopeptidase [Candidatus Hamiltonella defensa]
MGFTSELIHSNTQFMITLKEYQKRRQKLLAKMLPNSVALIFSAPQVFRSTDSEYLYRQNSYFNYLSGFKEPEALLVLIKETQKKTKSILLNRARDPLAETWSGARLGQEWAPQKLGIDHALPFDEIEEHLYLFLKNQEVVYHAQGQYAYADEIFFSACKKLRLKSRQSSSVPHVLMDWRPCLDEMRLLKSKEEINVLRKACEISAQAHIRAMKKCRPGLYEYHLESEIQYELSQRGARSPAYNSIVATGENACILHYTENESKLNAGNLVLIDAGCEYQGYAGDITRTFPVSGQFTAPQKALYDIVLAAQNKALELYKPGISIHEVTQEVTRIITAGLINLGILKGSLKKLHSQKAYKPFFMHGLSHWLGMDVHDVGDYGSDEKNRPLKERMVLTVEPGLYIFSDAKVPEQYRGIGIRIEDDILITKTGNENLTAAVPKDPELIESLMSSQEA